MKLLLSIICLLFVSCSARQINGRPQTFVEYVILNKYSNYSVEEHKKILESYGYDANPKAVFNFQPLENYPGVRLENWFKAEKVEK